MVTGASRGIGRSIAEIFAREGARLVISGRHQDTLDRAAREIESQGTEPRVKPVACHAGRPDQIRNLVESAMDAFGRVDIL